MFGASVFVYPFAAGWLVGWLVGFGSVSVSAMLSKRRARRAALLISALSVFVSNNSEASEGSRPQQRVSAKRSRLVPAPAQYLISVGSGPSDERESFSAADTNSSPSLGTSSNPKDKQLLAGVPASTNISCAASSSHRRSVWFARYLYRLYLYLTAAHENFITHRRTQPVGPSLSLL